MTSPPRSAPSRPARLAGVAADLRVTRTRALRGANLWYLRPAILAELRLGALAGLSEHDAGDVLARLRAELPGVNLDALDETRSDPTRIHPASSWWATLVARVALALQRLAGAEDQSGRLVLSAASEDRWTIAVTYEEESAGIDAVRQAARVVRDALRGDDAEIDDTVSALAERLRRARPDASTQLVIGAARRRGIPVRRSLDTDVVQLGLGAAQRRVLGSATERTSMFAADAAASARQVRDLLSGVGIPVLARDRVRSLEEANDAADDIGYPVRLVGSTEALAVPDAAAMRSAWDAMLGQDVTVEQLVDGAEVEVLVIDGRVRAATDISHRASGDTDRLSRLHPDVRAACELAAGALGLDVAGVEIATPDPATPLRAAGGVVRAVRVSPDLVPHTRTGAGPSPADAIVDMLYPEGTPTTIPIVAITGTNGKTTTTRLTAHLFRQTGRTVGFTTTDGVYLGEQLLMQGDLTGPFAANVILSHRDAQVAVLETARGGILKSGLGFDECDVAVVMNVTADHLGLGGIDTVEQLAEVKGVLPAMVKLGGHAVLNADDPLVWAMRRRTRGTVALFSMRGAGESTEVEERIAAGDVVGRVEMVDGAERLVIHHGARSVDLGATAEVPLTFGGLARFQVQNALAASVASYVQGVTPEQIRRGLLGFLPSSASTPGRLNFMETPRGRVLLDYAHNPAAIASLLGFVRAMPAGRRMALLSAPGDRRDDDLREIGRLAQGLDLVIMKEHEVYRRGRAPGAIAEVMAEGLRATGVPPERILTFVEEHDAVAHVMSVMQPGDIVVIIADDTEAVATQLRELR